MVLPAPHGHVLESYREGTFNRQGVKRERVAEWVASMAWEAGGRAERSVWALPGLENLRRSPKQPSAATMEGRSGEEDSPGQLNRLKQPTSAPHEDSWLEFWPGKGHRCTTYLIPSLGGTRHTLTVYDSKIPARHPSLLFLTCPALSHRSLAHSSRLSWNPSCPLGICRLFRDSWIFLPSFC